MEWHQGEFAIDLAPPDKDLVMVSTGTGIAPFVSMLRTYRGQDRWRRLVPINGVRRAADLGYRSELEAAARQDPGVIYVPLVTREPGDGE
jgi:ferredoxin--NADP+ reductase